MALVEIVMRREMAVGRKLYKPVWECEGVLRYSRLNFYTRREAVAWGERYAVRVRRLAWLQAHERRSERMRNRRWVLIGLGLVVLGLVALILWGVTAG